MLRRYSFYSVVVLVLVLMGGQVLAQGNVQNRQRAQRLLEQTDELLGRAKEVVQASGNPQAAQVYMQAVKLQGQARGSFSGGAYAACMLVTRRAQELATQSMSTARMSEQLEGRVLRKLERSEELMERVRTEISPGAVEDVRVLLETGQEILSRAWEFYRQGNYKPANKLAEQVGRSAQKILDSVRRMGHGEARYEQRRENVLRLMEQAEAGLADCESPLASGLLTQAREALQAADDHNRGQRPAVALSALKRSREMVQKVLRECRQSDQLEQRHQRLTAQTERLAERIPQAPATSRKAAERLISQAREQLTLARGHIDGKQNERAQAALHAAYLALEQARLHLSARH